MKTYICVKCAKTVCTFSNADTTRPQICPCGKSPEWHIAGKPTAKHNGGAK